MAKSYGDFTVKIEADGGFVCGDLYSKVTSYAYPTSDHARAAARGPAAAMRVARDMLLNERSLRATGATAPFSVEVLAQDERNWTRLTISSAAD
jgi:hypothetical protein